MTPGPVGDEGAVAAREGLERASERLSQRSKGFTSPARSPDLYWEGTGPALSAA
jgi:hypothetical protein